MVFGVLFVIAMITFVYHLKNNHNLHTLKRRLHKNRTATLPPKTHLNLSVSRNLIFIRVPNMNVDTADAPTTKESAITRALILNPRKKKYYLQLGSFAGLNEAEKLKSQLTLRVLMFLFDPHLHRLIIKY